MLYETNTKVSKVPKAQPNIKIIKTQSKLKQGIPYYVYEKMKLLTFWCAFPIDNHQNIQIFFKFQINQLCGHNFF